LSKWEAAEKYATERGWEFKIITENELYPARNKQKINSK
jgi:hypothetical protein